jgi:hypothetical protein
VVVLIRQSRAVGKVLETASHLSLTVEIFFSLFVEQTHKPE